MFAGHSPSSKDLHCIVKELENIHVGKHLTWPSTQLSSVHCMFEMAGSGSPSSGEEKPSVQYGR